MNGSLVRWLQRQGGMLVAPRRVISSLAPGEGTRDGTWLVLAYVLGSQLPRLFEAAARVVALRNFDTVVAAVADVGLAVLAPVLGMVAAEWILGRERSTHVALCLVPLVLVATVARIAQIGGVMPAWPSWVVPVVGGVWSVGLALWIRPSAPPAEEGAA